MVIQMLIKKSFVLAIGQIINKLLGIIFIIILTNNSDNTYIYTSAYLVFSIFEDLSTIGLVPATSKMVTKLKEEVAYFLYYGKRLTSFLGVIFFIIYLVMLKPISILTTNYDYTAMLIAGISLLILPRYYFNRGYVQGKMEMSCSAISLIVEGSIKVIVLLLGVFIHSVVFEYLALLSIFLANLIGNYILRFKIKNDESKKGKSYLITYFNVFLPYGMLVLFFTLYQAVDVFTLKRLLTNDSDLISSAYLYQANKLIYLPVIIASSFASTLIPGLKEKKNETVKSIFKYLTAILVIFFVLYNLFSSSIFEILYPNNKYYIILNNLSILIFFLSFYKIELGIIHSIGNVGIMVCCTWLSFLFKYILNKMLIPIYGFVAATYSTLFCVIFCIIFGLIIIHKAKIKILRYYLFYLLKYLLVSIISYIIFIYIKKIIVFDVNKVVTLILDLSLFCFIYVAVIVSTILWKFNE